MCLFVNLMKMTMQDLGWFHMSIPTKLFYYKLQKQLSLVLTTKGIVQQEFYLTQVARGVSLPKIYVAI